MKYFTCKGLIITVGEYHIVHLESDLQDVLFSSNMAGIQICQIELSTYSKLLFLPVIKGKRALGKKQTKENMWDALPCEPHMFKYKSIFSVRTKCHFQT